MKKSVLSALLLGSVALVTAQSNAKLFKQDPFLSKKAAIKHESQGQPVKQQAISHTSSHGASRAVSSVVIGTSGNLYTTQNDGTSQLSSDDSLGTVVFIHRGINNANTAPNMGQLIVDISKNKGTSFTTNVGPLNPPAVYNGTPSARFPQVVIHRPNNTLVADSAYAVYSAAWLDYTSSTGTGEQWEGEYHGVGRLDGAPSTFTDSAESINNSNALVGQSLTKGGENTGVFYTLNLNYNSYTNNIGTKNVASDTVYIGRGVWNATTKDVDWVYRKMAVTPAFFESATGDSSSLFSDFDIAFDPSGQNGWIALLGDFLSNDDYTVNPVFYKTTDGGTTWSAPIHVDLKDVQTVVAGLNPDLSGVPTATGNADLAVDADGNPHYVFTALSAAVVDENGDPLAYNTYPNGGASIYDLTFDPNAGPGCAWKGLLITDSLVSINDGDVAKGDAGSFITLGNSLAIATNTAHNKFFYTWLDTDPITGLNPAQNNFFYNISPNFFGKGYDVVTEKATLIKNFTDSDPVFGGNNIGTNGGAMFATVSQNVFENAGTYNVPVVFAEIDYQNVNPVGLPDAQNPARFYYIKDINFADAEFTQTVGDILPPIITLNGNDTAVVYLGTPYTDAGATAFDCQDGTVSTSTTSNVDANTPGEYTVRYIAVDNAGNADTAERVVVVGRIPIAQFTYTITNITNGKRFIFQDKSLYSPSTWAWTFGAGATPNTSASQNSQANYYANGTRQVKLTVTNQFGTDDTIVTINVVAVGLEDVAFSSNISLYPNPATNKINLDLSTEKAAEFNITILNMLGEVAVAERKVEITGNKVVELDVNSLSSGLYIVKVQDNNRVGIKTFTINR